MDHFQTLAWVRTGIPGAAVVPACRETYRIAFAGYMRLGPFGKVHDMEMRALLDDWDESQNVQKQMVRQLRGPSSSSQGIVYHLI